MHGMRCIYEEEIRRLQINVPDVSHLLSYFTAMGEDYPIQEVIFPF